MATVISDPLVGTIVDGRYEVVSRIARGGMATVYLAVDKRLDRNVALKVMHAHLADGVEGAEFVSRFRREARAAARLTHPGLVGIYDQGFDGETSYLTMEYVPGTNLRKRLRTERTLTLGDTLALLEEVLDGLAVAHRAGLVHRDIKPENVLLTEDGHVKLADFGLARAITEVTATATGTVLGTVAYLSPEVIATGHCDPRSDVYSVGVLAYEMLLGVHPHTGETPIQVAYKHVNTDVAAPSRAVWWMPVEVDDLVCALTAREPAERPRDASAALALVRHTRGQLSPADLERRVDPPAGDTAPDEQDAAASGSAGPDARAVVRVDDDPEALDAIPTAAFGAFGTGTRALPADSVRSAATPSVPRDAVAPQDPPRAARRGRRRRRWAWTLVVLVVVAGIFGGWTWWTSAGPGAYRTVPSNIMGAPVAQAEDALKSVGLTSTTREAFDDTVPQGDVVTVAPEEGTSVRKDEPVVLTVSDGVKEVQVPHDLAGHPVDEVLAALKAAELDNVGAPTEGYSDTVPVGSVLSVSVAEGARVPHNTAVTVVVSAGPAPVVVPQVTDSDVDTAKTTLKGFGLKTSVKEVFDGTAPRGTVMSQSPAQSVTAHRGDTVTLTVSKGPEMVKVPDVVGAKTADARTRLEADGFVVKVYKVAGGFFDSVRFQDPSGGKAPKGSTVNLTIF